MEILELLTHATRNKASDLHICSAHPPMVRIHGEMMSLKMQTLTPADIKSMIYSLMSEKQRADYENDMELDFAIQFGEMRFRVNAYNTVNGPAAAFRAIPTNILSLEELGMPDILARLSLLRKGLILVTGPTGSGKSTTLAAMINHINVTQAKHILTIEDPVEFVHKSKKALVNQRELGAHTASFKRALKSALREDPDVILVGEMRDPETIQLALTAAETGHLVMASLHTNSAPKTVDRIIDAFPGPDKPLIMSMLAGSLEGVISQVLVKRSDNSGRAAILEILVGSPAVRNLIREGKIPQLYSMIQIGAKSGMRTMKDSAFALVEQGIITQETAKSVLNMDKEAGGEEEQAKSPAASGSGEPRKFASQSSGHKGSHNEGGF